MAGFLDSLFNEMLTVFAAEASVLSLHSGDPGSTGTNEISGPGYERRPVTWSAPMNGDLEASNDVEFEVPAATSVSHVGFWDNASNYLGSVALHSVELFTGSGFLVLDPVVISLNN